MTTHASRRNRPAAPLFAALLHPECYPHPVRDVRVLETHISWVLLTGDYAYKIKKPVNLGFLDFTTLAARRYYCEEELRLNRRLAPELYLDVVAIRGSEQEPRVAGEGPVLDYAVKMREFPQEALASRLLERGAFGAREIDALAAGIAEFHAVSPAAAESERFGAPATVLSAALQNVEQMLSQVKLPPDEKALQTLRQWIKREFAARRDALAARKQRGFVRECHGDLHLRNIAVLDGRPVPFDCIEFNDELRWVDVMSEVAFVVMDLEDRRRSDLAWRFLNRYLEASGDYAGLAVLRFYLVYRALVRAKVHLLRARQPRIQRAEKVRLTHAFHQYLRLAARLAEAGSPALLITHGLSGSGKTTATQPLIELLGAIRLRSDLERKRLHGLAPLAASASGPGSGIYAREATTATYRRLAELAQSVLDAGYPVVVDATFLQRDEREAFRALATRLRVPFAILDFEAPEAALRARITGRRARADDASEADLSVIERQLATREPLAPEEMTATVAVDGTQTVSADSWRPLVERLRRAAGGKTPLSPGRAA